MSRGSFKAYFNRGLVATQALVHELGAPSAARLLRHIADPKDPLRAMLSGEIAEGLELLLDRADETSGEIRAALYELDDPNELEVRLQAADHGDPHARTVILGNARCTKQDHGERVDVVDGDAQNRQALCAAGVNVIDRILPSGHIPHNKFLVLKSNGIPTEVLMGSTNWTKTGLCTQTNNALLIEHPEVARRYAEYWDQLEKDTAQAERTGKWQGAELRDWARAHNLDAPIPIDSGTIEVLFSPNTTDSLNPKHPSRAEDMERVFELMRGAKHAILFLAFDPGNNSILDVAGEMQGKNKQLFVRGALTSAARANNFAEALHQAAGDVHASDKPHVALIADQHGEPDFRAVPAGAVGKQDTFGAWQVELGKVGHAIIHDKIVVIDPFDDDCVVITGSHNLGYRASHNNDEQLAIVRGHRALAEAYACHVLDVYDHFAWRYWLHQKHDLMGKPLDETEDWQNWYLRDGKPTSPELRFWLSAETSVDAHRRAPHRELAKQLQRPRRPVRARSATAVSGVAVR